MARQTKKEIENEIKVGLDIIANLKSHIIIKHLADIETHDGLGDSFLCYVDLDNDAKRTFGCVVKTDYWSGDLVISSPIFNMSIAEIKKTTQDNLGKFLNDKVAELNEALMSKDTTRFASENLQEFEESIKNINLPIAFKDTTDFADIIVTLSTVGTKVINNKSY